MFWVCVAVPFSVVIRGWKVMSVVEEDVTDSIVFVEFVVVNGVERFSSAVETRAVLSIDDWLVLVDLCSPVAISAEDISKVDCDIPDVDNMLVVGLLYSVVCDSIGVVMVVLWV